MVDRLAVPDDMLAALATGYGGAPAVRFLMRGQRARRRMLFRLLVQEWPDTAATDRPVAVLAAAEARTPAVLTELMDEPMTGAWAMSAIRLCRAGGTPTDRLSLAYGRLNALAAIAAVRAGAPAELTAHPLGGWLYLPTLGRLAVPVPDGTPVPLRVDGGRLTVDGRAVPIAAGLDPEPDGWQPVRRLRAGSGATTATVVLDDLDPYRDAYHVAAQKRLPAPTFHAWQATFQRAWEILSRRLPERAVELAAGLHTIVPLRRPDARAARSATVRDAVGAVGIDRAASPADLAVTLVHEFQHSKLTALTDLLELHTRDTNAVFFAPWRTDPRPIGALLQGGYAFLGVAQAWSVLAADPAAFPQAGQEFADLREQLRPVMDVLARSDLLTPAGRRFVRGMAAVAAALDRIALPASMVAAATAKLSAMRRAWQAQAGTGR